jgi:hypothetical protein
LDAITGDDENEWMRLIRKHEVLVADNSQHGQPEIRHQRLLSAARDFARHVYGVRVVSVENFLQHRWLSHLADEKTSGSFSYLTT